MKNKYIMLGALVLAAAAAGCDDDKQLTLNAEEVKLLETIEFDLTEELPLPVGRDTLITYKWGPDNADDTRILFSSSDENVATVSQEGLIKAIGEGTAIVTAQTALGFQINDAYASVRVKVIPQLIKVDQIDIVNTTAAGEDGKIYVTDELQLKATVHPDDATYTRLVWSSADESIATVDQNGKVVCLKEGTATIYATSTDRMGAKGSISFEINKYIAATDVHVTAPAESVCITYGAFDLAVTYEPAGATVGSVEWSTDNDAIATVHRGTVTPQGFGTCNITATCLETGASSTVQVTVEPGLWIWDAKSHWKGWKSNNLFPTESDVDVWHLEFPATAAGGKWRRDFAYDCNASKPLELRLKSYPVFAVRMTKMNGGNSTLDCVFDGYGNAGNPNPKNGIDLGDGTQLLIYNLGAAANYKDVDAAYFRVFQVKLADIPYDNVDPNAAYYDIKWLRTFKSTSEAEEFAREQVRQGL